MLLNSGLICAIFQQFGQSNELQHVKILQQVVNNYYNKHPTEVMSGLEHQTTDIMDVMYDSVTNDNFDRVSDDIDRVSGVVDNDYDMIDTDNDKCPVTMIMNKCLMTMIMNKCHMTMILPQEK